MKFHRPPKLIFCAALLVFLMGNAAPAISGDAAGGKTIVLAASTTQTTKKTTAVSSKKTATVKKKATSGKKTTAAPKTPATITPKASPTTPAVSATTPKETSTNASAVAKSLTTGDFNSGVKDAISQAVKSAIASLGKENGYYLNQLVKIPMPAQLKPVDDVLRDLGQTALSDRFIESMNRAAEKAVPKTADIFAKAVAAMTLEQAANLVKGPEDAATRYFESTTRENLKAQIKPLVDDSMKQAQVTAFYSAMMSKAQSYMPFLGFMTPDLNQYVTDKALDGLFLVMAEEEKKIRKDPVARTTDILKKVFGGIFK